MTAKKVNGSTDFRILAHCPATGEQVLGDRLTHFAVPGAKAAWWYCPKCEGWHVLIHMEQKNHLGEFYPSANLNLNSVQLSQ